MLKLKVSELELVAQGLNKIIQHADQRPDTVDSGLLYWAYRLSKKLQPEIEVLQQAKLPLLRKYAREVMQQQPGQMVKDDKGAMVPATRPTGRWNWKTPEDKEKYDEEIKETMEKDVTIEANIYKKTFDDILKLKIGGTILFELEPVLEEAPEKPTKDEKEK